MRVRALAEIAEKASQVMRGTFAPIIHLTRYSDFDATFAGHSNVQTWWLAAARRPVRPVAVTVHSIAVG